MNEKKQSGKKRLFLLCVSCVSALYFGSHFTNLNRIALRHTLDETIGFVKIRLEQYETDAANDRVKSLVRLLDKTVSLGNEMTLKESFGTQDLNSFAEEQRLTGALVLDENLNVVMQTTKGGNAMPLWEKLIDSPMYTISLIIQKRHTRPVWKKMGYSMILPRWHARMHQVS